jgi:hypothetical protein
MPTGRTKLGAIVGDHAKTGLGVLLDCGTVIGPFAHVLPTGGFAPRWIAARARVAASGTKDLQDLDRLFAAADTAMRRRGHSLSPALEAVYRAAIQRPVESGAGNVIPWRRSA